MQHCVQSVRADLGGQGEKWGHPSPTGRVALLQSCSTCGDFSRPAGTRRGTRHMSEPTVSCGTGHPLGISSENQRL